MDKIAGLMILFGIGVVIRGGWELYAGPEGEGGTTIVVGLFFVAAGFWLASRLPTDPGEAPAAPATDDDAGKRAAGTKPEVSGNDSAWFSVVESVEETVLDDVAGLARKDPRISHVGYDSGRYYSVPDGDDLPEWFALRIECRKDERDAVMQALEERIRAEMGPEALRRISLSYY